MEIIGNGRLNKMERQTVDSSAIVSVGYDPMSEVLEVEFHSGRVYKYYNVRQIVYDDLIRTSDEKRDESCRLSSEHRYLARSGHLPAAYNLSRRKASQFKDLHGYESCLHLYNLR